MATATIKFIGVLHGDIASRAEAPANYDASDRVGTLEIYPEYQEGLLGIAAGQVIVVLFWLDRAERDVLQVYPRGDKSQGLRGVFATRSPVRPNPIGVSEFTVLEVDNNRLTVSGVDIMANTPILDIKKKIG